MSSLYQKQTTLQIRSDGRRDATDEWLEQGGMHLEIEFFDES
jgi:hypothetical protein